MIDYRLSDDYYQGFIEYLLREATTSTMNNRCAIMFADVAGSTQMYDKLGNAEAEKQIAWCVNAMSDVTHRFHGRVIKTIGDEVMACFDTADTAVDAAIEMQASISGNASNELAIRIGMQFGEVIVRDGDLFGDSVNVAARMAGVAKAMQIITTEDLVSELSANRFAKTRLFDSTTVRGKLRELHIHQVIWEEEASVTQFAVPVEKNNHSAPKIQTLQLRFSDQIKNYRSDSFDGAVSIGRGDNCTIPLNAQFASRLHVNLECRRGKFVLVDHSTNGTYVQFREQGEIFLRREEMILTGEGIISLGESVKQDSPSLIHFSIS